MAFPKRPSLLMLILEKFSGREPDSAWNPASIAKVMTMYLAFEAMEQGKFTMDTTVTATQKMSIFLKYTPLVITKLR